MMLDKKRGAGEAPDGSSPDEKRAKGESIHADANQNSAEEKPQQTSTSDAAPADQKEWKGWCEIDSDPAIFNVMLKEFGVQGAKVQEVIGLDDELLAWVNKPINGLIFLFRYSNAIPYQGKASCPEHIWFANQTTDNLCASVALLNIVNNVPGLELGENLAAFKAFTQPLTPPLRGYALSHNFDFVRRVHNSFARKQDMINADRTLARQSKKRGTASRGSAADDDDSSETAYHFIAFVPVEGEVWMLDGMDRQPTMVGAIDGAYDNWIDQAKPKIVERMELYQETEVNFALLAVVQDPLIRLRKELVENISLVRSLRTRLDALSQDWRGFLSTEEAVADEGCLYTTDHSLLAANPQMNQASAMRNGVEEEAISSSDLQQLTEQWKDAVVAQTQLRAKIQAEQQQEYEDADAAQKRRFDHSPAIRTWLGYLAAKPEFEELLRRYEG